MVDMGSDPPERRHRVRVRVDGRAHIRSAYATTVSAALVDLSEGGVRCVLPDAPEAFAPGVRFERTVSPRGRGCHIADLPRRSRVDPWSQAEAGHALRRCIRRPR